MTHLIRLAIWFIAAIAICWPASFSPSGLLIGNPDIDVWNHAWGYWYVYQQLLDGNGLIHTDLVGAPEGGTLYFIDTPGALVALPITALFGPAVAYNATIIGRVALAGFAGQLLAREWSQRIGAHTWLAGLACATTPFLLCELNNGISEVCATQWMIFSFWAAAKAFRRNLWKDWLLLGLFLGLTATSTFYYGLTAALLIGPAMAYNVFKRWLGDLNSGQALLGAMAAGTVGLLIFSPHAILFWESLNASDALIQRETTLNDRLLMHNAVDPKIYFMPGHYQSVDLLEIFQEPFIHTGYLRWSVILLAGIALASLPKLRLWGGIAILSLVLGMGPYLWMNGGWVSVGGQYLSLPFDWLRTALPEIAITHPLRLSIGAQICCCALAACGAAWTLDRVPTRLKKVVLLGLGFTIVAESLWGSSAIWPLKNADADIPEFYRQKRAGAVLDLPAEVDRTMKSSRHFWMQTAHKRPIPYSPDVRLGSAKDATSFEFFRSFIGSAQQVDNSSARAKIMSHIQSTYGLIVLHPDLDETQALQFKSLFDEKFKQSTAIESQGKWYWEFNGQSQQEGPIAGKPSICDTLGKRLEGLKKNTDVSDLVKCGKKLSQYCTSWAREGNGNATASRLCAKQFAKHPIDRDRDVLRLLLTHRDEGVRKAAQETINGRR